MSYCELPEFYYETFPKARKEYPCVECPAPIEKGEVHLHYRGKWDGEIDSGRQHMVCRELCMFIRDEYQGGECLAFGELFESESEYYFTSTYDRSRAKWTERDRKARSLMAKIKWRMRKHRYMGKRLPNGTWVKRIWGQEWQMGACE